MIHKMRIAFIIIIALLNFPLIGAQVLRKSVEALYITTPLTIDGKMDEAVYQVAIPATDFVQLQPNNGQSAFEPTEVYFFYDQTAIYVGALLHDHPDSIHNFLSARDNIGMSDYFGVYFDPYNQGQLAYGFFITPAGIQTDLKAVKGEYDHEDGSWDAVWESSTSVTDSGWIVEMRIPYSALRFSRDAGSVWGLNMFRNIRRHSSNNSWNFIDRKVAGFIHQSGQLTGIQNVSPPIRLSVSPYAATYSEFHTRPNSTEFIYKGGMDLKYGISESFTLDMMLIPDFGQIQSDDQRLNLSPYEIYYDEKRQFFTEGTELFDRAGVLYSRRIGAAPKFGYRAGQDLSENEVIEFRPTETQIINATKVSGRTSDGIGLGILNAMTLPSYAAIRDTVADISRRFEVQPFTNYNMAVIDKSLQNNSYIGLFNSNVSMLNSPFMANVTGTDFQFRDKSKTYALQGKTAISTRNDPDRETGFSARLEAAKNSGKFQYGISQAIISDKFNINDLGFMRRNNEMITDLRVSHRHLESFLAFREVHTFLRWNHTRIFRPNTLFANQAMLSIFALLKNNYAVEVNTTVTGDKFDYYEPRSENRFFYQPYEIRYSFYTRSDTRKPLWASTVFAGLEQPDTGKSGRFYYLRTYLRVGRHVQMSYMFGLENLSNDRGFAGMDRNSDIIYFARRDIKTVENVIGPTYAINNKASISLRLRHYWSSAKNNEFFQLQQDGTLLENEGYSRADNNYNSLNMDMVFRWIFAPGSELSVAWKNSVLDYGDRVESHYFRNLEQILRSGQINSLSVKMLYYVDYNSIRR
jgi:hypothetical protein